MKRRVRVSWVDSNQTEGVVEYDKDGEIVSLTVDDHTFKKDELLEVERFIDLETGQVIWHGLHDEWWSSIPPDEPEYPLVEEDEDFDECEDDWDPARENPPEVSRPRPDYERYR